MMKTTKEKYYTPVEIAREMKVTRGAVYGWIKDKKIPYVKIKGTVRIPQKEFDKLREKRTVRPKD